MGGELGVYKKVYRGVQTSEFEKELIELVLRGEFQIMGFTVREVMEGLRSVYVALN